MSEQTKTLSELLLAHHKLSATSERHSANFEELKGMLMVVSARQTEQMKDTGVLGSSSGSLLSSAKDENTPPVIETPQAEVTETHPEPLSNRDRKHHSRVDFLKFDGSDLADWIFRSEHYFEIDETPEEAKLKIAIIHLEGDALQWHQGFARVLQHQGRRRTWKE